MTFRVVAEKAILAFEGRVVTRPPQAESRAAPRFFSANGDDSPGDRNVEWHGAAAGSRSE